MSRVPTATHWLRWAEAVVAKLKLIATAIRGVEPDQLYVAKDSIDSVHDLGFPVGVSAHNPTATEALESRGWPVDYYLACFYQVTRRSSNLWSARPSPATR